MYEDQYNASKRMDIYYYLLYLLYVICLEMTFLIIIADEYDQVIKNESYSLW